MFISIVVIAKYLHIFPSDDSQSWNIEETVSEIKKRKYSRYLFFQLYPYSRFILLYSQLPSWFDPESKTLSVDDLSKTLNLLYYFINFGGPFAMEKIAKSSEIVVENESTKFEEYFPMTNIVNDNSETQLILDRLRSDNDHLFEKEVSHCQNYTGFMILLKLLHRTN